MRPAGESSAEPVVIRFWTFQQSALDIQEAQERVRQRFEAENLHLRVEVRTFPSPHYRPQLLEALRSSHPPDIATLDQVWMAEFAESGAILPLDGLLAREAQARLFFPSAWETCLYKDHVWGVPLSIDGWMLLYYNKELFRRAGLDPEHPPTTWPALQEVGRRLTQPPEQYGLVLLGAADEGLVASINAFIYSNDGQVVDASTGQARINQPEAVEALEFYRELTRFAPPGTEKRNEAAAVELFLSGKVAMALLGSWQQDTFRLRAPELDWGVAVLPAPLGKEPHSTAGGWNLVVFAASPHPEEAFKYIEFLSRLDVQPEVTSLIPARLDAGRRFIRKQRREPDVVRYMLEQGMPRPVSPAYSRITEAQQRMMQRILAGAPVQEAADEAAAEINQLRH
ncbi:sugar ABC transporter substrate-binding protein [Vitiosangium sp. GDMCC 1.1324]|uniref:ABC transporter substrate-binding protein n=1 Tax=Vitiosangium sp. (strain GDMCC 1.1324) TaxID=2138576 RepID=UPI00130EA27A|nr:sugar ABC transporter substrate-binding protein [Vitiosangium sp. GDMCC 1.1324]